MFESPFMNFGMDPATMGMDPATLARMTTAMTGNPDMAKELMVKMGIPPPGMEGPGGGLGAALAGAPTGVPGTTLGSMPQPGGPAGPMPAPGGPPGGGMPGMQEISNMFRGIAAPKAPTVDMKAGVSGSQGAMPGKPPQMKTSELDLLMQMIGGGRQSPMVVPPLAALLGGRR